MQSTPAGADEPGRGEHWGPVPTPDPREWGDQTRREVLALLGTLQHPVTAQDVADALGGHPNTARNHLDRLRADGLVERTRAGVTGRTLNDVRRGQDVVAHGPAPAGPPKRGTMGRPSWVYRATSVGRSAARRLGQEHPLADHSQFVVALVDYLADRDDPRREAWEVGTRWGRRVSATSPGDADVVGVLDLLGFSPEPSPEGDGLLLRSCPLLEHARSHPEVVCEIHRGLMAGVARVRPDEISVEPFAHPLGCLVGRVPEEESGQVLHLNRRDGTGEVDPEHLGVERQF